MATDRVIQRLTVAAARADGEAEPLADATSSALLDRAATILTSMEGYSRGAIEMYTDDGCNRRDERGERSPVIGVHDPPGLEVRDDLFDNTSNLVDLGVELPAPSPAAPGGPAS